MNNTAFIIRTLAVSLSLCAASAMAAETVSTYAATPTSSLFSNVGDHGAVHHSGANSGLGGAVSVAKNIVSDAATWQTSSPNQNSVLLSTPGVAASASLPLSLSTSALLLTANGEKTAQRAATKVREFDTSAISQPGIYTMILVGVGLLILRSHRKLGQDEKFAV
jgi:hypothetical protein